MPVDDEGAGGAAVRGPAALRRLTLAATFLTGVPLKTQGEASATDLRASMGWYPLVGLALGAAGWGVYAGLLALLPSLVAAALTILLLEAATRGLHLDGLMDTCDGCLSGAPRARALEIMKDSSVGAMGVAGAVLVLILKVTALGALSRVDAAVPLLVGYSAARALPSLDVYIWPYARAAGTGEPFAREPAKRPILLALGLLAVGLAIAGAAGVALSAAGSWYAGLIVAVVAMGVPLLVQAAVARRLGGLTGDVYGMGIELAEAAGLVAGCAVMTLAG